MPSPDLKQLRSEIVRLFRLQISIMEKKVFGVASDSELREYDHRRDELGKLQCQLRQRKKAA